MNVQAGDPGHPFEQLEARPGRVVGGQRGGGQSQRDEHGAGHDMARRPRRQQPDRRNAGKRHKKQQGEQRQAHRANLAAAAWLAVSVR